MEANGQRDSTKTSSRDKWWNCPRGSNERVRKILLAEQNNRSSVGRSICRYDQIEPIVGACLGAMRAVRSQERRETASSGGKVRRRRGNDARRGGLT